MLLLKCIDLRSDPRRQSLNLSYNLFGDHRLKHRREITKAWYLRLLEFLLRLLYERVSLNNDFQQTLDESLRFVHFLVSDQESDQFIRVSLRGVIRHRVLVANLSLPFFLETKA